MKGVSPIVASVVLVSFTVSIALLFFSWSSGMSRTTASNVSSQAIEAVACSSAGINIDTIYIQNFTNCSALIMNTGEVDLYSSISLISTNGSIFSSPGYLLPKSASLLAEIANCTISCSSFSKAVASTSCQGISRTITDKRKIFFDGTMCSGCDSIATGMVLDTSFQGAGNSTADSSSYSNNGVCYNMPNSNCNWTSSPYDSQGYGISFDGSNDYLNISDSSSLNIENDITLEA